MEGVHGCTHRVTNFLWVSQLEEGPCCLELEDTAEERQCQGPCDTRAAMTRTNSRQYSAHFKYNGRQVQGRQAVVAGKSLTYMPNLATPS